MWVWFAKLIGADTSGVDAANAKADAGIAAADQRDLASGLLDSKTFQQYVIDEKRSADSNYGPAADQVNAAFDAGLKTGFNNVTGAISSTINAPFQFAWKAIPLWIWIAAALWILWELGWLKKWITPK